MKVTLLGTADCAGIPAYGCDCSICQQAKIQSNLRRNKTSALLECNNQKWLIDANVADINQQQSLADLAGIFITHFHMDHVSALFDIRWGVGTNIPVYCPPDKLGADDLYTHAGILEYCSVEVFNPYQFANFTVTPVPLNHSKLCYGYVFESKNKCFAYLTDTYDLPKETLQLLQRKQPNYIFLDVAYVSYATETKKRNHNDIAMLTKIANQLSQSKIILIHVSHHVLNWLNESNNSTLLPSNCFLSNDLAVFS